MPLRIITAPAGSGLTAHLRGLAGGTKRYVLIARPKPTSWWTLPHTLGVKGGTLVSAIKAALSGFRGVLILDCPFVADHFTKHVLNTLKHSSGRVRVIVGLEAGVQGQRFKPVTEQFSDVDPVLREVADGSALCLRIARSTVVNGCSEDTFAQAVRARVKNGVAKVEAFVRAALGALPEISKSRFLLLGGVVEPDVEAVIDTTTLAVLWEADAVEAHKTVASLSAVGLLSVEADNIRVHKLITTIIHRPPDKTVLRLLDDADTPYLQNTRVRLELSTNRRKQAINTALNYVRTRGRCLHASTDITKVLKEWPGYQPNDRLEFCVSSEEVEEGLRLLSSALYKAGVYAGGDVVEEAYQIYGRLFVWRGRNAVVRRFLIGLDLFGGAVRRGEKGDGRTIGVEV